MAAAVTWTIGVTQWGPWQCQRGVARSAGAEIRVSRGGGVRYTCWRPRAREGSRPNLTRTLALGARKPDAHLQRSSRRADRAPRAPRGPPTEATLQKRAGQRTPARCRRRIDASGGGSSSAEQRGKSPGAASWLFARDLSPRPNLLRKTEVCPLMREGSPQVCPPTGGAHLNSNNHRPRALRRLAAVTCC